MKNKSKGSIVKWIKMHKKELAVAGISITAIIAIILGYKNRKQLIMLWEKLQEVINKDADIHSLTNNVVVDIVDEAENMMEILEPTQLIVVDTNNVNQISYEVSKHIRNLPEGWHPSPEKIATAKENGIRLLPNQTWVIDHMKGGAVA